MSYRHNIFHRGIMVDEEGLPFVCDHTDTSRFIIKSLILSEILRELNEARVKMLAKGYEEVLVDEPRSTGYGETEWRLEGIRPMTDEEKQWYLDEQAKIASRREKNDKHEYERLKAKYEKE